MNPPIAWASWMEPFSISGLMPKLVTKFRMSLFFNCWNVFRAGIFLDTLKAYFIVIRPLYFPSQFPTLTPLLYVHGSSLNNVYVE